MQNAKKNHYLIDALVIVFIFAYIYKPFFLSLSAVLSLLLIGSMLVLCVNYGAKINGNANLILGFIGICLVIFCPSIINPADNNVKTFLSCQFVFFIIPVLFILLNDVLSTKDKKIIIITTLCLWFYSLITTLLGLQIYPYASRLTAGWATEVQKNLYYGLNIGGYEFIYATVFLAPFVLFWIYDRYSNKLLRVMGLVFYVVSLFTVVASQYAIAVVLIIVGTIVLFVRKKKKYVRIILWLTIGICSICLLALSDVVLNLLVELASENEMGSLYNRLFTFKNALQVDGLKNFDRFRLYKKSIDAMFSYPVVGGSWFSGVSYSEHSGFLDVFAKYGILGFVWLLYLHTIKGKVVSISEDTGVYRTIMSLFLIFGFLNMFDIYIDISISIFMLIPMMLSIQDNNQNQRSSKVVAI